MARTIYYILGAPTIHRSEKCAKASNTYPQAFRRIILPDYEDMPRYTRSVLPHMHICLKCWHYDVDKGSD